MDSYVYSYGNTVSGAIASVDTSGAEVIYDDSILKSKSWFKSDYAEKDYGKL
jgi:hypothetical protein